MRILIAAALSLPGVLAALLIDDKKALAAMGESFEVHGKGATVVIPEEAAAG